MVDFNSCEVLVIKELWPHLSVACGIEVSQARAQIGIDYSSFCQALDTLVEKGVLNGDGDSGYRRGDLRCIFVSDFLGKEPWDVGGKLLYRKRTYSLERFLSEEVQDIEVTPLVDAKTVRIAQTAWSLIKDDQFKRLSIEEVVKKGNFKSAEEVTDCLLTLSQIDILIGDPEKGYKRGNSRLAIPDSSPSSDGQLNSKHCEVFYLDNGGSSRQEIPLLNLLVVEGADQFTIAGDIDANGSDNVPPAGDPKGSDIKERILISARRLKVAAAAWPVLSDTELRTINFEAVGESIGIPRDQMYPEIAYLVKLGVLIREGTKPDYRYRLGNPEVTTRFGNLVSKVELAPGITVVDGQELNIAELVEQIGKAKKPANPAPKPGPEFPQGDVPPVEKDNGASVNEGDPKGPSPLVAQIEEPAVSMDDISVHLKGTISVAAKVVNQAEGVLDAANKKFDQLQESLRAAQSECDQAKSEYHKAVSAYEKLSEAEKALNGEEIN